MADQKTKVCSYCDSVVDGSLNICPNCGSELPEDSTINKDNTINKPEPTTTDKQLTIDDKKDLPSANGFAFASFFLAIMVLVVCIVYSYSSGSENVNNNTNTQGTTLCFKTFAKDSEVELKIVYKNDVVEEYVWTQSFEVNPTEADRILKVLDEEFAQFSEVEGYSLENQVSDDKTRVFIIMQVVTKEFNIESLIEIEHEMFNADFVPANWNYKKMLSDLKSSGFRCGQ